MAYRGPGQTDGHWFFFVKHPFLLFSLLKALRRSGGPLWLSFLYGTLNINTTLIIKHKRAVQNTPWEVYYQIILELLPTRDSAFDYIGQLHFRMRRPQSERSASGLTTCLSNYKNNITEQMNRWKYVRECLVCPK